MVTRSWSRVLLNLTSALAAFSVGLLPSSAFAAPSARCASASSIASALTSAAGERGAFRGEPSRASVTLTVCWREAGLVELRVTKQGSRRLDRLGSAVSVYSAEGSSLLLRRQPVTLDAHGSSVQTYAFTARPGVSALGLYSSLIVDWAGDGAPAERVAVRLSPPGA